MKGCVVRDFTSVFPEPHISHLELLCASGPYAGTIAVLDITGCGLFPVAQDII